MTDQKEQPVAAGNTVLRSGSILFHAGCILFGVGLCILPFLGFDMLLDPRTTQTLIFQIYTPLCFALVAAGMLMSGKWQGFRVTIADIALFAFVGISVISSYISSVPPHSFLTDNIMYVGALVYLLARVVPVKTAYFLLAGVSLAAAGVALIGLLQVYGIELIAYGEMERRGKEVFLSTMGNPNYVSSFLAPVVLVTLGIGFYTKNIFLRSAFILVSIYLISAVIISGARAATGGTFIGCAVALVLYLFFQFGKKGFLLFLIVGLAAVVTLSLLLAIGGDSLETLRGVWKANTLRTRAFQWMIGQQMFLDHPFLGIGPGMFFTEYNDYQFQFFQQDHSYLYRNVVVYGDGKIWDHSHNELLQILIERGIAGAFAFSVLLISPIVGVLTILYRGQLPLSLGRRAASLPFFAAALVTTTVDGFWGFPLFLPVSTAVFYFVLGFLVQLVSEDRALSKIQSGWEVSSRRSLSTLTMVTCALLLVFALLFSYLAYSKISAIRTRVMFFANRELLDDNPLRVEALQQSIFYTPYLVMPPPYMVSDFYVKNDRLEEAAEYLRRLSKVFNIGSIGYYQLASIEAKVDDSGAAEQSLLRALVLDPENTRAMEYLALIYVQSENIQGARALISQLQKIGYENPDTYYLKGRLEEIEGRPDLAVKSYTVALRLAQVEPLRLAQKNQIEARRDYLQESFAGR